MPREILITHRNIEDPIQEIAFTELPSMLSVAQHWIEERPTMGSVTQAIRSGFYKKSEKYGYKTDFIVNFNYLRQAVEESHEFTTANLSEKNGELGDILFLLLHFANGAGVSADDVVSYINKEMLPSYQDDKLPLSTRVVNSVFRKSPIPAMVKWYKESIGGDNIELLGIMSGDEAPWTLNRNSIEWNDYKQSLVAGWALVFGTICQYSIENKIPLLETIYQTATKASYNFPSPFFRPELTPFSSGPTSNQAEISCCRLFRKSLVELGKTYIDQYHQIFDEQKIANDPILFRQWIHGSMLSILKESKNEDFKNTAYWLLKSFKWESFE